MSGFSTGTYSYGWNLNLVSLITMRVAMAQVLIRKSAMVFFATTLAFVERHFG